MTKKSVFILGFVVLIFLVLGGYVLAQPAGTEATLSVTSGQATVSRPQNFLFFNNSQQTALASGAVFAVSQGDTVEVAAASSATLTMGDGSSVDLFPDTIVQVSELVADNANFRVRLSLASGRITNRVQRLLKADDLYDVQTPSSTASVRGTVFTVAVISDEATIFSVNEGVVAVAMSGQEVMVEAGFEVTAVTGQPLNVLPQSPTANKPSIETAVDSASAQPSLGTETESEVGLESVSSAEGEQPVEESSINDQSGADNTDINRNPTNNMESSGDGTADVGTATLLPTATDTSQPRQPATETPVSANATLVPPTNTLVPPTNTLIPPTNTLVPPTNTLIPPTATLTLPTNTPVPPATATPEPPTQEPQVTICHNGNTITVDATAVQAHLDHGDTLGPCP